MNDELDLLRSFRSDIPGPSTDAWARARAAMAQAEAEGGPSVEPAPSPPARRHRRTPRRWRLAVTAAAAVVVLLSLLAGVGVIGGGGGLSRPLTTPWRASRAFVPADHALRHGTWHLVDALLSGTWQQNVFGPSGTSLSCSPDGTCYILAGKYPSAMYNAPLLGVTLYVSTDDGGTWSALPVPSGLDPATPLECSGPRWCATGGTYNGQAVLAVTRNGGHSFTIDPLPAGVGTLHAVSCPSTGDCAGLASRSKNPTLANTEWMNATFLVTDNGGSTFDDEPILADDSMSDLVCTSATHCTVVGTTDASINSPVPAGVSAVTSNQGRSWTAGSLPEGTGINPVLASLACPDSQRCFVTGFLTTERGSDIAASDNGGVTWSLDVLPADVPRPQLDAIACATASECWAAGGESVHHKIGNVTNAESSVLLGTTNGGSSWSKVIFSVPSTAPNDTSQSYLTIGPVSCPSQGVCVAMGSTAQGSSYAPIYSLVVPGG